MYAMRGNILFPVGTARSLLFSKKLLREVVGERLMYVPSAGYCLALVVVGVSYSMSRLTMRSYTST